MKKEEVIEQFGKSIDKLDGFVDYLIRQPNSLVHAAVKKDVGAFITEKSWWSGSSGIGRASVVGVFRDGQVKTLSFTYRDQYDAQKDDYRYCFRKIEILKVSEKEIEVKASPNERDGSPRFYTFEITAKPAEKKTVKKITEKAKKAFEERVCRLINMTVEKHKHNHPLFRLETHARDAVYDHANELAAFILAEQIDTDRCTEYGSGWLGDQYRYSVWKIAGNNEPVRIFEDHAYSKERGCDIRGLAIVNGEISFMNYRGDEIKIKI